jgi:hypothetical protein
LIDEDILDLDVAVNDARLVQIAHGLAQIAKDVEYFGFGEARVLRQAVVHELNETTEATVFGEQEDFVDVVTLTLNRRVDVFENFAILFAQRFLSNIFFFNYIISQ